MLRKNTKETKKLLNNNLCTCSFCEMNQDKQSIMPFILTRIALFSTIIGLAILIMLLFTSCSYASPVPLTDKTAILSIIGEAEAESQTGKIAIAEAIRNRGTLKGVYGARSKRVINKLYTNKTYLLAKAAWFDSLNTDYVKGADHWGSDSDIVKFKKESWFKNCKQTARIGNHSFFKCGE